MLIDNQIFDAFKVGEIAYYQYKMKQLELEAYFSAMVKSK